MLKEHITKQTAPLGAIPMKKAPRKSQGEECSSWGQEQELGGCAPCVAMLAFPSGQAGAWCHLLWLPQRQEQRSGKILWGFSSDMRKKHSNDPFLRKPIESCALPSSPSPRSTQSRLWAGKLTFPTLVYAQPHHQSNSSLAWHPTPHSSRKRCY